MARLRERAAFTARIASNIRPSRENGSGISAIFGRVRRMRRYERKHRPAGNTPHALIDKSYGHRMDNERMREWSKMRTTIPSSDGC